MIRAYKAKYIRFEDEDANRKGSLIVIEIHHRKLNIIQLVVCNETQLLLATAIDSITEIAGYHHYQPKTKAIAAFGIGGLSELPTNSRDGLLESISAAAHIEYKPLANNFGKGLLEIDNDYVFLMEEI
jgi:hypothetical protein